MTIDDLLDCGMTRESMERSGLCSSRYLTLKEFGLVSYTLVGVFRKDASPLEQGEYERIVVTSVVWSIHIFDL
jgi:hypothetical protein